MRVPQEVHGAGLGAAFATSVMWGMTGVFVRLLPSVSPLLITSARMIVALAAALPFVLLVPALRRRLGEAAGARRAWWLSLHLALYYVTAVAGYQLAPVAEVALFLSMSPLMAVGLAALQRAPVRRAEVQGAVLALAGVTVVVLPGILAGASTPTRLWGDLLGLASAASAAVYTDAYRRYGAEGRAPDGLAVTVLGFAVGGVLLFAGAAATGPARPEVFAGSALPYLLGLGLVCTLLPSLLTAFASQRLPAVVTTTFRLLIPVFAAVFAFVVLGEVPSLWVFPGGALILGGLLWMLRPKARVPAA